MSPDAALKHREKPQADPAHAKPPFQEEMKVFLGQFNLFIPEVKDPQVTIKEIREQIDGLVGAAEHFDTTVKDIDFTGIIHDGENRKALEEARALMDMDFYKALVSYYEDLEKQMATVLEQIKDLGVNYFVDGDGYSERVVNDLEIILRKMAEAEQFNRCTLSPLSREYADLSAKNDEDKAIQDEYTTQRPDIVLKDFPEDTSYYLQALARLNRVAYMLPKGLTPEEIKTEMLRVTKIIFAHLQSQLPGQALSIIRKQQRPPGARILDKIKQSPLEKIEFLLGIVTRCTRVLGNIRYQKNLLLADAQQQHTEAVTSVSA